MYFPTKNDDFRGTYAGEYVCMIKAQNQGQVLSHCYAYIFPGVGAYLAVYQQRQ